MNSNYLVIIKNASKMFFVFEDKDFTISKEIEDSKLFSSVFHGLDFKFLDNSLLVNNIEMSYEEEKTVNDYDIIVYKEMRFKTYQFKDSIVIGSSNKCDIKLDTNDLIYIDLDCDGNRVLHSRIPIYLNGKLCSNNAILNVGDYLLINNEIIFISDGHIKINEKIVCSLKEQFKDVAKTNYKSYHRSPRLYYLPNKDTLKIEAPSQKIKQNNKGLIKVIIPPLIMLCITVTISILMKRGLFIIMSISATIMTIIKSVSSYFSDRKSAKEDNIKREKRYSDYLVRKSIEINLRVQEELEAINYQFPTPHEIYEFTQNESRRIYEKSMEDVDFLEVRIGNHTRKPSFKIDLPEQKINDDFDELYENAKQLRENFNDLTNVGLSIDLKRNNVGIIGTKELAVLLVEQMLLEIMTFHSYHDVQLLTIFNQGQLKDLEWLSYSPNSKIDAINVRGLIYNEVLRDQILGSFTQILKDREQKFKENDKVSFVPHYVVSILSSDVIKEHSIMEFLNKDIRHLGVSIIVVESAIEHLKENVKTVLEIYSRQRSRLLIENGVYVRKDFDLDQLPTKDELLRHSRTLKGFNHVIGTENGLPKMVTFLEMYDVNKVADLNVRTRWMQNDSTKSLAVRLGVTGEDYVDLNLHEKAHGPHGLVAGTTGSGKSEIVQSYILSLAINFHPHEVAFLLIDYKGGGMANMFLSLPHLIGTITNLDKDGSMRALVSIKAELLRRQEIFSKYNVNHINQYIRLFKNGEATEPMPHLFLISDEFAELKSEQPEFMKELVSTARIGRSLGIHLILATQKPSGVVDSQIWSNSKFKLCLKVQDAADSKEMLKTADAANIVEPGRAYLQVGNNEIYELFQSAWSGADYFGKDIENKVDKRIYMVNRLGQHKLLTKDLSQIKDDKSVEKVNTELEAVVAEVERNFESTNDKKVKPIWLEDLKERYYLDDYIEINHKANELNMMFGMVDIPSMQKQVLYDEPLEKLGNIAIIGSSGYGKSYALMTGLISLFSRNTVEDVYSYVLDFGNNALINLRNLPHVADYITMDDDEKIMKFINILNDTVDERKKIFAKAGANHISLYNKMSESKMPSLVIVVDNFDVVKEEFEALQNTFNKLSRDCTSLGIYFMFSGQKMSSFKTTMVNNMKTRIALRGIDKYEYKNVVGKGDFLPKELPGHSLVRIDGQANVMQIMLPAKGEDDITLVNAISEKVKSISNNYDGVKAKGIMIVDENIDHKEIVELAKLKDSEFTVGVDYEKVQPVKYNLNNIKLLSIVSLMERGKTNIISFILSQKIKDIVILDGNKKSLVKYKDQYEYYVIEDISDILQKMEDGELKGKTLITDSGDELIKSMSAVQSKKFIEMLQNSDFKLIIAYNVSVLREKVGDFTSALKNNTNNIIQTLPEEQNIISFTIQERKAKFKFGDVIVTNGSQKIKVRVPKMGENDEENIT